MNEDTRQEVIKALSQKVPIEDIANMAETEAEEILKIKEEAADEIHSRQRNGDCDNE